MKKDKVATMEKEIRAYYLKICLSILVAIALVIAYILVMLWFCAGVLSGQYISEKINTLYTVTGKCSEVSSSGRARHGQKFYYKLYVDGVEFRIYDDDISDYPESDTFVNVLTNSEVIIQYVTNISGDNNIQSLQLSDGTVIADFEYVKKQNNTDIILWCIVTVIFLLLTLPVLCYGCYWMIHSAKYNAKNKIPVIKRRLNRMAEREKIFSEQDEE